MKKSLLSLVTFMVISVGCTNAQTVWGIRAGIGVPTVSSKGESMTGEIGLEIGPTLYYSLSNVNEKLYLNAAALYSRKSFDILTLQYLEIPVYLGYRIPFRKVDTYCQAGPYAAFKIASEPASNVTGFDAGLAIMYGINISRFKIEAGAKYGFTSIVSEGDVKLFTPFLGVSYIF